MKNNFLMGTAFAALVNLSANQALGLSLPILNDADIFEVNSGLGDGSLFKCVVFAGPENVPSGRYFSVHFELIPSASGFPLKATASRVYFQLGESVDPTRAMHFNSGGSQWLTLQAFEEAEDFPGADWRYIDVAASLPNTTLVKAVHKQTEFFIGFRFAEEDGQHYGWMRFNRPDTNFLTFFQLTGWDWNPLAGKPIGAGQPPVIPVQSAFTDEGQLRLQWPAEVANWVLESSPTLGPDAVWEPVADVVGTEHLLAPPETDRFYRLRRP